MPNLPHLSGITQIKIANVQTKAFIRNLPTKWWLISKPLEKLIPSSNIFHSGLADKFRTYMNIQICETLLNFYFKWDYWHRCYEQLLVYNSIKIVTKAAKMLISKILSNDIFIFTYFIVNNHLFWLFVSHQQDKQWLLLRYYQGKRKHGKWL